MHVFLHVSFQLAPFYKQWSFRTMSFTQLCHGPFYIIQAVLGQSYRTGTCYIGPNWKRIFNINNGEDILFPFYPNTYLVTIGKIPIFCSFVLITHVQVSIDSLFSFFLPASHTTRVTRRDLEVKFEDFKFYLINSEFDGKCPLDFKEHWIVLLYKMSAINLEN